ncbi:MAG: NUDIX domain-containing protein [Sideroxydans sp.]|nr:NUDIX domain-containing protein [Sideroxydans sp.]
MVWKPNVTVAAVIEQDGKFLLVEEQTERGILFNQPAGHWEADETLTAGAAREVLEEAAYEFEPQQLVGIYRWHAPGSDITYLRFAFAGRILDHHPERKLDDGIIRAVWMTPDEIRATQERHRSPLILRCVEDYLAGKRYPLDMIVHYD